MTTDLIAIPQPDVLMRLSEWTGKRTELLQSAAAMKTVETDRDLDATGALQTLIGKHIRDLETERKRVTAPIDKLKKDIIDQEKDMRAGLEVEHARLKRLNDAYATRKAIEAEAERKRLRLEEEHRRMIEAEKQMAAQELFGPETVIEPTPAPVIAPAPIQDRAQLSNNRTVKRWSYQVIDAQLVPREYLCLEERKVRGYIAYCEKMGTDPVIPGIQFEARMSVEGR